MRLFAPFETNTQTYTDMKSQYGSVFRKSWRAAIFAAASLPLIIGPGAFAQASPASGGSDEKVQQLEKFVVTGSYIPIAGTVTAIPVTTLDSKAIEATGITTDLLDVLRKAAPQFVGNGNIGSDNANTNSGATGGGSAVAFRNTQTLVLLNGRRAAYSPILASGGGQFFDVGLIPIAAVDRIEILQDGASAIYGTDAVAGVVNIILKTNFTGFEMGANYSFSEKKGHYSQRKFNITGGTSNEKTNVVFSAEWLSVDPLIQSERKVSSPSFGTASFAGVVNDAAGNFFVLNPTLNAPPAGKVPMATLIATGVYIPVNQNNLITGVGTEAQFAFDLSKFPTLLLGKERRSVTLNSDHKWTDRISLFGDLLYTQTSTISVLNAQPVNFNYAVSSPFNPTTDTVIRARNRFLDHPREYFYESTSLRGILGMRGTVGDNITWEMAANKNYVDMSYVNPGVIDTAAKLAAAASTVNFFARQQAPGVVNASGMFGTAIGLATSTLTTYDARMTGKLMDLPGGEVGFAIGGDYRIETLKQTSDRASQGATFSWDAATTLDPFNASRDIKSAFFNLRVPVFGGNNAPSGFHLLEVEGAVRHEVYSDTDDPTVPKISVRWLPFDDQLALRATYSKSFSAPTLFSLFGPGGVGFTGGLTLARFGGGAPISGQANGTAGANPNLLPSTAKGATVGLVWSPKSVKGFSVTLDYFKIEQEKLVGTIGAATILQSVELLGPASPFANLVRIGPASDPTQFKNGAPITAPGQIGRAPSIDSVYVTDTLVNLATQRLSGLDLKVDYTWNHDTWGRFDASFTGSYYLFYKAVALPGTDEFETAGLVTAYNGTLPRWNTYTNITWSRGKWGANLGWAYKPEVKDLDFTNPAETDTAFDSKIEAYNTVDLSVHYTFGSESKWLNGLKLRVGANNLFDETPPHDKAAYGGVNADVGTYDPIGRLIFIDATYKF